MGRRGHGEKTRQELLGAAEQLVEDGGLEALTVRSVADAVGTSTRAVYSLFGSKEGLIVGLGRRAFELLSAELEALPSTRDPAADLIAAGVTVFRGFAIEHPALFRLGIQRTLPEPRLATSFVAAASEALEVLEGRVERVRAAGLLGGRAVRDCVRAFHALCEGLAAMELMSLFTPGDEERQWRDALSALVGGFTLPLPCEPNPR